MVWPIIAAILSAFIEWIRIKSVHGQVENVSKIWSVTVGFVLLGVCLSLEFSYYSDPTFISVILYSFYFATVRGALYDPFLNMFRGLKLDYISNSTNSWIDRNIGSKVPFWAIRGVYALLSVFFYYLKTIT